MDYGEAIEVLERANEKFEFPVNWGIDLQSEHERYLTEKYAKKPVIVTNYPKDIKAFYMRVNDDGRTVAAMDVLAPGIGDIGGSQREERLEVLDRNMAERGIDKSTRSTTPGTATCAATAWCRTPASASASSAPSPTSLASPTFATQSPSRAPPATRGTDAHTLTLASPRVGLAASRMGAISPAGRRTFAVNGMATLFASFSRTRPAASVRYSSRRGTWRSSIPSTVSPIRP